MAQTSEKFYLRPLLTYQYFSMFVSICVLNSQFDVLHGLNRRRIIDNCVQYDMRNMEPKFPKFSRRMDGYLGHAGVVVTRVGRGDCPSAQKGFS